MEKLKKAKFGLGIMIGTTLGTLIGGYPLDGAFAAGMVIGVIAIIAENMIKGRS